MEAPSIASQPAKAEAGGSRNSNFELLRLFCMLLIILHHYGVHGASSYHPGTLSVASVYLQCLTPLGKIGVNCFVLVSGYFLVNSSFNLRKVFQLVAQVWFYSFAFLGGVLLFQGDPNVLHHLGKVALALECGQYWFMPVYLFMLCLSPFMNLAIRGASRRALAWLIALLLGLWCLCPALLGFAPEYSQLGWFCTLYLIAASLRLHATPWADSLRVSVLGLAGSVIAVPVYLVVADARRNLAGLPGDPAAPLWDMNHALVLLIALFLFLVARNLPPWRSRLVNTLSPAVLGIYLLHDNPYTRELLWLRWVDNSSLDGSVVVIVHSLAVSLGLLAVCLSADLVRGRLAARFIRPWFDRCFSAVQERVSGAR